MTSDADAVSVCIDAGTTVIKAVVFDAEGRELFVASRGTLVSRPAPGRAEQDMPEVWDAVVTTVREALRAVRRPVRLIALTAQGDGCWLVDRERRPVRPAVLWNDARGADVVQRWRSDGALERAFRINGSLTNAGLPNAILSVLASEESHVLDDASAALTCGGWLFSKLTGRVVLDTSDASAPWLDIEDLSYSQELLEAYGLPWAQRLLPEVLADDARLQELDRQAATELGVPAGTPVVLAPYDIASTALGTGAVDVGQACSVLGTTLCTETVIGAPDTAGEPSGLTISLGQPDRRLRAFPTLAGCGVIDWTVDLLGLSGPEELSGLAADSEAGAGGLHLLPYLSPAGERAPFLNPAASGLLGGFTFDHGRVELARAVLEGLAHVVRDCLQAAPTRPEELRLCGGGATSGVWCRIIADVTGVPTVRTEDSQVGAKGALMVGLVAAGEFADLADATNALVRVRDRYEPDGSVRALYDAEHEEFLATRSLAEQRWVAWQQARTRLQGEQSRA